MQIYGAGETLCIGSLDLFGCAKLCFPALFSQHNFIVYVPKALHSHDASSSWRALGLCIHPHLWVNFKVGDSPSILAALCFKTVPQPSSNESQSAQEHIFPDRQTDTRRVSDIHVMGNCWSWGNFNISRNCVPDSFSLPNNVIVPSNLKACCPASSVLNTQEQKEKHWSSRRVTEWWNYNQGVVEHLNH